LIGRLKIARIALGLSGLLGGVGAAMAQAPAVTIALAPSSDTGESEFDGVTRDNTPKIGGTAAPNAEIKVLDGDREVARVTAAWSGAWSADAAGLADGPHSLVAHVSSPTSAASDPLFIVVDTVRPFASAIELAGPVAHGPGGSTVTNDTTPTLSGSTEPSSAVTVRDGTTVIGLPSVVNGLWTLTTPLAEGRHRLSARTEDGAGNATTSRLTLVVTSRPLGAPTITLRPRSDTGASASDGVTRDTTPTVAGTAPPKAKVSVLDGDRVVATTVASKAGAWTSTLRRRADGERLLRARAGEVTSGAMSIVVDTRKPKVPTIAVAGGLETGTPTLTGRTTPLAIVSLQQGSAVIGTAAADVDGLWSYTTPPLAQGKYQFAAFATDLAGNVSNPAPPIKVLIGEDVARKVTIDLLASSDTSRSDDDVTRDRTPTLAGTASPWTTVTVRDGANVLGTTKAEGSKWRFTAPLLSSGVHSLTATAAGRTSRSLAVTIEDGPVLIDLDGLTPAQGSRFDGAMANARGGFSVAGAGDVNADGEPDIIIGAPRETSGDDRGAAYLVFGQAEGWPATLDLAALGDAGVRMTGGESPLFGEAVAGVGDVNGDGVDDVALIDAGGSSGGVYIVFGRASFPPTLDLSQFDGSNGGAIFTGFADSVGPAGDVNHDGIRDLVVDFAVVFGRTDLTNRPIADLLNGSDGFVFEGTHSFCSGNNRSAGVGDVNGDGIDDVAFGDSGFERFSSTYGDVISGAVYVVHGRQTGFPASFDAEQDPIDYGFRILGPILYSGACLGTAVAGAGDVDGDGLDDILASAPEQASAYLVYGRSDGYGGTLDLDTQANQTLRLYQLRGASAAGDADGDGLADVAVSPALGAVSVLYGRDARRTGTFDLETLDGLEGFRIVGAPPSNYSDYSLNHVPDSKGDGRDGLLIGAPDADPLGRTDAGSTYLIFGLGGE
jgi:hypothetical protein